MLKNNIAIIIADAISDTITVLDVKLKSLLKSILSYSYTTLFIIKITGIKNPNNIGTKQDRCNNIFLLIELSLSVNFFVFG